MLVCSYSGAKARLHWESVRAHIPALFKLVNWGTNTQAVLRTKMCSGTRERHWSVQTEGAEPRGGEGLMPGHEAEGARPAVPWVHPVAGSLPSESFVIIPDVSGR